MDLNNGYLQDLMPEEREAMTGAKPQTVAQPAPADETPADAAGATDDGADQGIDEGTGSSDADAGAAAADGKAADEPVDQAAAAAALAELDAGQTKTEAPRAFEVPADDFNAKRTELRTQKRAVHEKWANGELSDTEYFEQTDAIDDQIAAAVAEQSRKATLADINRQNEERVRQAQADAENQAMAAVALAAKKAGHIDYATDALACQQFDAQFAAVRLDPANAKLPPVEQAQKAHNLVLAMRGIAPTAAAAPAAAPASPTKAVIPPSLASMPAAAAQPIGADPLDDIMAIEDPDVREARWAALTPAQRTAALRTTVPAARKH